MLFFLLSGTARAASTSELITKLGDPNLSVEDRTRIEETLGTRADATGIQGLIDLTKNGSTETVRQSAAEILGSYADNPSKRSTVLGALESSVTSDSSYSVRYAAGSAIQRILASSPLSVTAHTTQSLVADLSKPGTLGKDRIIDVLGEYGDERAIQPIADALRSSTDSETRTSAARALTRFSKNHSGVDVVSLEMQTLTTDPEYTVRYSAGSSLARLAESDHRIVPLLIAQAKSPGDAQEQVVSTLVTIGDPRAIPTFEALLTPGTSQELRYDAIRGFQSMSSNPEAIHAAISVVNDSDSYISGAALDILENGLPKTFGKLSAADRRTAMDALIARLGDTDPGRRTQAAFLISQVLTHEMRLHPRSRLAGIISHCLPKGSQPEVHVSGVAVAFDVLFFGGLPVTSVAQAEHDSRGQTPTVAAWSPDEIESLRALVDSALKS